MSHIVLAFSHDPTDWISNVMAFFTYGKWTHVAIVNGDQVIESSAIGNPKGVRMVSLSDFMEKHPGTILRAMPAQDPDAIWRFCESKIGEGYDWLWVFSYAFRLKLENRNKWTCSELLCAAYKETNDPLYEAMSAGNGCHSASPRDQFMLTRPI